MTRISAARPDLSARSVEATSTTGTPEKAPSRANPSAVRADAYTPSREGIETPSTKWREVYIDGSQEKEHEKFASWGREHAAIQQAIAQKLGKVMRGQHASQIGAVKVRLEVLDDIPQFAKQGIFAKPGVLDGVARFSSSPGVPTPSDEPSPRGFAMSLRSVDGKQQDFLLNNMNGFMRDTGEVMALVRARAAASSVPKLFEVPTLFAVAAAQIGPRRAASIFKRLREHLQRPGQSLATEEYFSNMPIQVGPYAAKVALRPLDTRGDLGSRTLEEDLQARLAKGEVAFELGLQFYRDDASTPIEDMTSPWKAPFVPVARVVIPKQDLSSASAKALAKEVEKTSFSPWRTAAHRPLGQIGRSRKEIYSQSSETRGGCPYGFR